MQSKPSLPCILAVVLFTAPFHVLAETYSVTLPTPATPGPASAFHLGTPAGPNAPAITVNGQCLLSDGSPILPVMGEFHYSRVDPGRWRDELLKMKAGGITLVSTYVFWNHHEELENQWNWSGQRDLRGFLQTCKDVHLPVIVRLGPWCHGEVRNGGFPDWLLAKKLKLRSEDPAFVHEVQLLYAQIARQMDGLLYKDGGPVIGVQLDNEYRGRASYLLGLKTIARDSGIDTPLYTRTGWPNLTSAMPFGEILPLYGAYAEGFWDRSLDSMPATYWQAFTFAPERTDTAVGTDVLGNRNRTDEGDAQQYPYLTCELGGGMETSYHRRIHIDPRDAHSLEIAKLGSGSNLPGFYMYHGGTNPGAATPGVYLNENQATQTTNYNDMPDKSYDFLAPLGQYGQVREPYHLLRRTHLFLHDWQAVLAPMPPTFPGNKITKSDNTDLRFAIRSDGHRGFIFVNNYQRGLDMPAKENVRFAITLAGENQPLLVPATPMSVPADTAFFLPFNMDINGITLRSATAQPVCQVTDGDTTTMVFAAIPGIPVEFVFPENTALDTVNPVRHEPGAIIISDIATNGKFAIELHNNNHTIRILVFDRENSLRVWRASVAGKERILLTPANQTLFTDGTTLTLQTTDAVASFDLTVIPPIPGMKILPQVALAPLLPVTIQQTQKQGELRKINMGVNKAAAEPTDADFAGSQPAVFNIALPPELNPARHVLLRIHYVGDVARLYIGDKLVTDNFYNGTPFDLDLGSIAGDLHTGAQQLTLKILPLQKEAPIYIQKKDMPDFGSSVSIATLGTVELVEIRSMEFKP